MKLKLKKVNIDKKHKTEIENSSSKTDDILKSFESVEKYNEYCALNAKQKKFREQTKIQNQFDTYFVVYFETEEQKQSFCNLHKLDYDFVFFRDLDINVKGD